MFRDRYVSGQTPTEVSEAELDQLVEERIKDADKHYPGLSLALRTLFVNTGFEGLERTLDTER